MRIGLLGLGLVGKAMIRRFMRQGHAIAGYDVDDGTASAAARLFDIELCQSPQEIARTCRLVFLSLPNSACVTEALWGSKPIGPVCGPGTVILDTTTADPEETVQHHHRLAKTGVRFIDVPLVGSSQDIGEGKAVAIVGGRQDDSAGFLPILESFSKEVFFFGQAGNGHRAKLVVNLVLGLHRVVLSEGLGLASKCGLNTGQILEVLKGSAACSQVMRDQGERMLRQDFENPAARLAQHAKDVRLIVRMAEAAGARHPLSKVHSKLLDEALEAGWGQLDNAAVMKLFTSR